MSASWFWVSTFLIWIFGPKLIPPNNQSSATLWVLDTCLIVSFNYHFDHCFVVFKSVQLRFNVRRMCVGGYVIKLPSQCPKSKLTHPYVVQRNDFRFCRTVRNRSLFLAHPTDGDKSLTSQNTQDTS